ncbi:MAG: phosphate signaling complex PhoU family protein [Candidatus Latescibacterota bacterium]
MIIDLIRTWKQQAFSSQIVEEFVSMLESSEEMLSYAFRVLLQEIPADEYAENIYKKDQSINFRERDIRKRILIHLSTEQKCNLSACLALISVSKDAERLGDYVKNIFELQKLLGDSICDRELFTMLFNQTGREILGLFRKTAEAFRDSNRDLAAEVVNSGRDLGRRCEDIIEKVADSDYTARQAVVLALGARYLKRVALHLSNIASSVVNPLPEMDYLDTGGQ